MTLKELGAPGTVIGVTEFEAMEAILVPVMDIAVTVNVTGEAIGSPDTVHDVEGTDAEHDCPELDVAVYDDRAPVPVAIGASHETVADNPLANVA